MTISKPMAAGRSLLHRLWRRLSPAYRHRENQRRWNDSWSRPDFDAPWLGRPVSKEIVKAVAEGWLSRASPALDIGCGQGEIVGWLAAQGFFTVGVDIAEAAVIRARALYPPTPGKLEFHALDLCKQSPPDHGYGTLIDRGCFHQIPSADWPAFLRNLLRVSAPDARMIVLIKAFRDGQSVGDPTELRRVNAQVNRCFGEAFTVVDSAPTFLDPFEGTKQGNEMPGMAYWLIRKPSASQ